MALFPSVRVGLIDDKLSLFPTITDQLKSQLDLVICRDVEGVNMIEADANIVKNETVLAPWLWQIRPAPTSTVRSIRSSPEVGKKNS